MATLQEWLALTSSGDAQNETARRAGIPQATYSRQITRGVLTPENVVAIARAYRVSPIDGLVAIGLIRDSDITQVSVRKALLEASDDDLVEETWRRLKDAHDHPKLTEPLSQAKTLS
jgi:hypothetical protein